MSGQNTQYFTISETARERFKFFALSHLVISGLSALASLAVSFISGGALLLIPVELFFYVFCGFKLAREGRWGRPTPGLALATFGLPAVVALTWGLGGTGLLFLGSAGATVGFFILVSAALFAHPSFMIMLLNLQYLHLELPLDPRWFAWILVAALLPPALFTVGTLLGGRAKDTGSYTSAPVQQ